MNLAEITQKITAAVGENSGIGKIIALDFGSDGAICIDASVVPNKVNNDVIDADTTIKLTIDDLVAMGKGELEPMMAFMSGKLKVEGDVFLAQKLIPLLKS